MRDNALYFPYINVPESDWFTRVLLYWDKVSSIVPNDYIYNPERLDPYMRSLVEAGLVHQVIPGKYIDEIPHFEEPFISYVRKILAEQEKFGSSNYLSKRFQQSTLIHIEKLGDIAEELIDLGVAKRQNNYPWYKVDFWVAEAFMAYLASVLGKHEEVNAAPVTYLDTSFALLSGYNYSESIQGRRRKIRDYIVKYLLPSPEGKVDIDELVKFKDKHGKSLSRLRNTVEDTCIELANISDENTTKERMELTVKQFNNDVEEIKEAMRTYWSRTTFTILLPLLSTGGGVITAVYGNEPLLGAVLGLPGLATAIYQAFAGDTSYQEKMQHPLAYAALAQHTFK
jgi:hypothetical protein